LSVVSCQLELSVVSCQLAVLSNVATDNWQLTTDN